MGPRMASEWTQNDPPGPPLRRSPDGPQMTLRSLIPRPQISYAQNKGLFTVLLTIAEIKQCRPRIGYARLVNPRNVLMVVNSTDLQDVINLGHTRNPEN